MLSTRIWAIFIDVDLEHRTRVIFTATNKVSKVLAHLIALDIAVSLRLNSSDAALNRVST